MYPGSFYPEISAAVRRNTGQTKLSHAPVAIDQDDLFVSFSYKLNLKGMFYLHFTFIPYCFIIELTVIPGKGRKEKSLY